MTGEIFLFSLNVVGSRQLFLSRMMICLISLPSGRLHFISDAQKPIIYLKAIKKNFHPVAEVMKLESYTFFFKVILFSSLPISPDKSPDLFSSSF